MYSYRRFALYCVALLTIAPDVSAAPADAMAKGLAPHKALYDIDLVATHSGSQVLNISGQMVYETKPTCDSWVTDHRFKLYYEYADAPAMQITSDFATMETFDGRDFDYASRRFRDGSLYQEIVGHAALTDKGGTASFSKPEGTKFDLVPGTLFPMSHTVELIRQAKAGKKFYSAQVFDGSDEEGPIEINTFIGKKSGPWKEAAAKKIDASMLSGDAWNVRMAVFPAADREEESDYEMSMVFHENGIISDMTIEYDDFSVKQKLVALEKLPAFSCGSAAPAGKKP